MAWQDRLRQAAYTSPSGERFTFDYEDVSEQFEKKATAFDFPDADGTYIQDNGATSRRYPLRVILWGDDYDVAAQAFMDALAERGEGTLEHPIYGQHTVVPFGQVTRRDDLKTAANQAVLEVAFWATTGLIYPSSQASPEAETAAAVDQCTAATATEFAETSDLEGALQQATLRGKVTRLLDGARTRLQSVADTLDAAKRRFTAIADSIETGIDVLIADPLSLAFQTTQLIHAPAVAAAAIQDRLAAYEALADSIISGEGADTSNEFLANNVYVVNAVTGSIVSVLNTEFSTRGEALRAATDIIDQFDAAVVWRDAQYPAFGLTDAGGAYQQLQEAVALAAGFLVQLSFDLAQERAIVVDRARTIVDLSAELYGAVDSRLDFLINTNDLTGSEILEIPAGKRIVYYA